MNTPSFTVLPHFKYRLPVLNTIQVLSIIPGYSLSTIYLPVPIYTTNTVYYYYYFFSHLLHPHSIALLLL